MSVSLVPCPRSAETIALLDTLLRAAHEGRVIGLAAVVFMPHSKSFVDAAGEPMRRSMYARGGVAALDDLLRVQQAAQQFENTN